MTAWLIVVYKLPTEPTRYRAAIWRKLRAAGAIYLQNGVATLPATPENERIVRGLVQEIRDMTGTAYLIQGEQVGDAAALVETFNAARDAEYAELLGRCADFHAELAREREARNFTFAELEENEEDLTKLELWMTKIQRRDFFSAGRQADAEQAIAACREDLQNFTTAVYQAADEGTAPTVDE